MQKRPYKAIALAGIFFFATFLKIRSFYLYPGYHWRQFIVYILPFCLFYLACSTIVFTRWLKLSFLQKAVFVGIGVQYILDLLYYEFNSNFLMNRSLSGIEWWLSYYPGFALDPFQYLYNRIFINPRTVYTHGNAVFFFHYWEMGLLFPIMQTVCAGFVGFCCGKIILLYRNNYFGRLVKESRRYSFIAATSILFGIAGYVLAAISEDYFVIFFLLSILSIIFGHISRRRIIR